MEGTSMHFGNKNLTDETQTSDRSTFAIITDHGKCAVTIYTTGGSIYQFCLTSQELYMWRFKRKQALTRAFFFVTSLLKPVCVTEGQMLVGLQQHRIQPASNSH